MSLSCVGVESGVDSLFSGEKEFTLSESAYGDRLYGSSVFYQQSGGTRSFEVLEVTLQLLAMLEEDNLALRCSHIARYLNVWADRLGRRNQLLKTEWSLHVQVFSQFGQFWELSCLDRVAARWSEKFLLYVFPFPV